MLDFIQAQLVYWPSKSSSQLFIYLILMTYCGKFYNKVFFSLSVVYFISLYLFINRIQISHIQVVKLKAEVERFDSEESSSTLFKNLNKKKILLPCRIVFREKNEVDYGISKPKRCIKCVKLCRVPLS